MATDEQPRAEHRHGHVHIDEAGWRELAAQIELEGELLLGFVSRPVGWLMDLRPGDASQVLRVLDVGCGPGVGTCELATLFPEARVQAVDSSPTMLEWANQRAAARGLEARISTHLAELPGGLDGLERVDIIWASMSLHHVGDEIAALRALRHLLEPSGLIAIAELAEPMRVLPDELDVGRPGFADRLDRAGAAWFAAMRDGLTGSVPSSDLASMLTSAGFEVVDSRLARERLDAPLSDRARHMVLGHLRRGRDHLTDYLDADDLRTLHVLSDAGDPRSVMHRPDVFVAASRQILIARTRQ
jgi:2-polyprenyl-3-methyl-5-hydroxy-6-metoxy-1,4-benzoquinol methylase